MDIIQDVYAVSIESKFKPAQTFPDIGSLINLLSRNALVFAGIIFFLVFVYVGFRYIKAAGKGDPGEIQKVANVMTTALVGLLLVFGAYFIVYIIETVTGISILNP